jgi:uncharacterized protein (DUF849 family)
MKKQNEAWLEVAINGVAGKGFQPLIPITPEEIINQAVDCAKAGATIIHTHVYDDKGQPTEDADLYRRVIEGIKEQVDIIVYPTVALSGTAQERYAPLEALASHGLLDWGVVDPGSVNISHTSQVQNDIDGISYVNPDSHIRHGLALAKRDGWRPAYAIYEPGFLRLGNALAQQAELDQTPIYRLMFSDNLLFGTRPTEYALEFYAEMIKEELGSDAVWMISGLDANIEQLIQPALDLGAHVRVGLEDAPFGCSKTNLQLVEDAVTKIDNAGFEIVAPALIG